MSEQRNDIDIQELLAVALDDTPSEGFTDRVLEHLAVLKTAIELSRLVGVAPLDWVSAPAEGTERSDNDEGDDDD